MTYSRNLKLHFLTVNIVIVRLYKLRGGREGEGEGVKIYVLNIKITVVFQKYTNIYYEIDCM